MNSSYIKTMATAAIFTAAIAVCSMLSVPTPFGMPITLQTLAVSLSGFCLKKKAGVAVIAYIALGAVGLPIFSAFSGGIGVILGQNGGFLIGFLPLCMLCSFAAGVKSIIAKYIFPIMGLIVCHSLGIAWFAFVTKSGIIAAAAAVSLPFIIKDLILIFVAYRIYLRIKRYI